MLDDGRKLKGFVAMAIVNCELRITATATHYTGGVTSTSNLDGRN